MGETIKEVEAAIENIKKEQARERAIANVAERRFNRPEFGRKDKVFPLAEGELAEERQAAPMHRRERAFIKDQDEEMPEIKQRKMEVPPSEKKSLEKKRQEEKKKKRT